MRCNNRIAVRVHSYPATVYLSVPILAFSENITIRIENLLLAPSHDIAHIQPQVSFYAHYSQFGCMQLVYIHNQIIQ